jgi:hypothetical protein
MDSEDCDQTNCDDCCPLANDEQTKPMTNADRIRAMTDEELADWIARTQIANVAEALEIVGVQWERKAGMKDEMSKEVLEWLQQPAKGDA